MTFTFDDLKALREEGFTDDQIGSVLAQEDQSISDVLKEGFTLEQITSTISGQPIPEGFAAQPAEPERDFFSVEDVFSALGGVPEALAVGLPAAAVKGYRGLSMPERSQAIEDEMAFAQRVQQDQEDREAAGKATSVGSAIRGALPSLGFSATNLPIAIGAGMAGTAVAGPVAGTASAMAASGTASYRMAGADLLYRAFKTLEENKGAPLTDEEKADAYRELLPFAQDAGLWEAGPEAVSNVLMMKAGKFIFGFGKGKATQLVGEAIEKTNKTLARKIAEKTAVGVGTVGAEVLSEGVTAMGQFPAEKAITKYAMTGEAEGGVTEYPGGYVQAVKDVAPSTIALTGMMGLGAGGVRLASLPFRQQKSPEQIAQDNIDLEAEREANNLMIPPTDEEAKGLQASVERMRQSAQEKKEIYAGLEPTDPAAQQLGMEIRELEKAVQLAEAEIAKRVTPEAEQARLAREIAAPAAITPAPTAEAPALTPAPVSETITPAEEAAPAAKPTDEFMDKRNKDLFPDTTDFAGKLPTDVRINSYTEKDGIGTAEYVNPANGSTDVYISAFGDNDFIAYIRIYDDQGNPTNRFASKLERRTERAGASRAMIEELQSRLPANHEYTEDVSASTDGLRFISSQLQRGYDLVRDANGNVETNRIAINGESIVNDLGADVVRQGQEFADIQVTNKKTFDRVKGVIAPILERFNAGLGENNIYWENGRVYVDIPVLRKAEPSVAAPVSETITPAEEAAPVVPSPTPVTTPPVAEAPAAATAPEVAPAGIVEQVPVNRRTEYSALAAKSPWANDLQNKPTGWKFVESPDGATLVSIDGSKIVRFESEDKRSGTEALRKKSEAQAWAIDNPLSLGDSTTPTPSKLRGEAEATPAGIAVGSRIKLGKSPQTYTIEEVLPQSATERELGEQYYSVKNERTGEVQTVEAKDLKPVKAKGVRKMAARVKDESLVVPEAERYTFEQAEAEARKLFGGMPEGFIIVNDSVDPEYEFKAGYEPSTGNIILNLAYIRQGESVRNLIAHELGHYAAGDPEIRAKLQEFLDALPPATRAKLERFVERVYNDETGDIRLEEKQVRAFVQMLKAGDQRNAFQKLLDAIKKWLNEKLGTNFQPTDMDAAAVLSGAINRFNAGEFIAREEETGILAARPERREQQAGRKGVGKVITTPKGINVRTENIIRSDVFNGDTVSKENTDKAYDIIDKLSGADKEASNKYAEEINDLVRGKLSEEEGRKVEQSIGAVKLGNELFKYAANLAGKGDLRMLQLLTDRFNDLSTGYGSVGAGARDLQARTDLSNWVTFASKAQKKGIINAVAIKIYGPNATQEQIKTIEDAINKVNKTKVEDADEIYTDLETTGEKQGVDIRKAVDRAMDRIPPQNRDPWVVALEVLKDVEGFESFQYVKVKGMDEKKLKQEILSAITRSIKKNLADFQKKMSKKGAEGMEITFWKTMSDEERKIGPLGEVDMAVNRNLSAIVRDTLIKMGLKGAPIDPVKEPEKAKMTLIEQVANILTNNKLTDAKITEADERISAEIASRETAEIKAAEESGADPDVIEMIEAKYSAIREAWDMSMSRQLDIPISDATLRRLIFNRLKDSNVKMSELVQQIKDDPAVGEARKASIVRQIIKELNGINEDGTIQAEYQKLADALNTQLSQMVENNKLKGRMKSAVKAVARDANKPDAQAEKQINKLATLQSDVNEWPQSKEDKVRDIVRNDLKQKLDLGLKVAPKIKAAWIPTLTNNLKKVGVSDATAQTLAELVWRQHEINYMNRKMQQIERAVTGGSLAPIIDAIKSTPLSQQQEAGWKRKVAYDYLINAGLDKQNAARVADLMDITLQKVLAEAQAKAFYDTVKGTLAEERSRRGMKRFLEAIRTGALDPSKNITSELAEQNGWTGFTPEQYARLAELDTLVNNEDILDLERATAFKEIQDIIAAAKVPPRVRDTLSSYYVAQALSGIPTATVNIFSPIGYALRYAFTAGARTAIRNPSQLPMVFSSMLSAFKSYTSEVAYSWKNNVQRRGVVEYLANDDKLLELFNKGKKQWEQGKRSEGFKNMLFGSMEYVSRMLKALDEGAISVLEQQGLTRYAMAAMDKAGIKSSEQIAVANMVMKSKQEFILNSIAKGMSKRDAIAFSDDVYRSAWQEALSNLKIDSQEVLDSAINDALAAVGRINTSVNALTGEETKRVSDRGFASSIPIGFLESISKAANSQDANELQRIFYRMTYGFAIVPARVFREAAWFTPYGFVRFAVDSAARGMGYSSPYAQSLGTDIQRQQRLTETIAGSIVMLGALAMASSSIDDPEDELPFKIVFTGNGPDRRKDPQFFDTWRKKFKPNSINIFFGKTKFSINIERGFEAFAVPFMLAGAVDDWRIRKQFEQTKKTPQDLSDAAIILGSAFMSFNKRGPYAAFIDTYSTASNSDNILASATKQAAFYAKTFVPVLGTSLARNVSDFINDPIDKTTLDGALYSNIPVLGPMMGTKSMNAVGQSQGATEFSDRLYRAGIPLVFSLPKNNESEKINQLILKQGQGPSIPTRYNVRQRLGYEPNNKQYEKFVTEYGKYMAKTMTENHKLLMEKSPASYMKWIEKRSETARSIATRAAKEIPNPNSP